MADSFEDEEPPDGRSIFFRVIEGLTVVAFVVAVFVWQSDGTLNAARDLIADWGFGSGSGQSGRPAPPPTDFRLAAQSGGSGLGDPEGLDPTSTGSIAPPPLNLATDGATRKSPPVAAAGWRAACDGGTPRFCTASQSLALAGDASLETSWTIEKGDDGLVAIWTTPTDVMVSRGMSLKLGNNTPKTVPFDSCGPHSCEVRAKLASDFFALLRRSGTARTEIVLRGGRTVTFEFVPDGLTAALDKLGV